MLSASGTSAVLGYETEHLTNAAKMLEYAGRGRMIRASMYPSEPYEKQPKAVPLDLSQLARQLMRCEPRLDVLKPDLAASYPPIVKLIEGSLSRSTNTHAILLPELRAADNLSIGVFADYGGEHAEAKYTTYSFLIFGMNHAGFLRDEFAKIRSKHDLEKEVAFKHLNDGPLKRALADYLHATDFTAGLLFTLAVNKKATTLFGPNGKESIKQLADDLRKSDLGVYRPAVAEKLLRVLHVSAYFTGLLSREGQELFWFSDNDAIIPNLELAQKTVEHWQRLLPSYSKHNYGKIRWTAPEFLDDKIGKPVLDFLSMTDLAAGAVSSYLTRRSQEEHLKLSASEAKIVNWLGRQGIGLKKLAVVIEPEGSTGLVSHQLLFQNA
jgi:hypothetical protein